MTHEAARSPRARCLCGSGGAERARGRDHHARRLLDGAYLGPADQSPDERDPNDAVRLVFEGNEQIADAELLKVTTVDKPQWHAENSSKELFERDVLLLTSEYYDRGFLDVAVSPGPITASKTWPYHEAHVSITEGIRYRMRGLSVVEHDTKGLEVTTLGGGKAKLRARFPIADGAWFSRRLVLSGVTDINHLYRDAAFGNAEVDPHSRVDKEHGIVEIDVEIHRGSPVTIDRVVIAGNANVKADAIERQLLPMAKQPYSETNLETSKARLVATGLFERVDVSTSATPDATHWTVTFEVEEKKSKR